VKVLILGKERYLRYWRALGMAQALGAQLARPTAALYARELVTGSSVSPTPTPSQPWVPISGACVRVWTSPSLHPKPAARVLGLLDRSQPQNGLQSHVWAK
jgi:hypothetical protein